MHWADVEKRQPTLAALGRRRLIDPGVVLVVTVRADGTPRLSPVEPLIIDDDLVLLMLWKSRKAADLARDPRVLVHSITTSRDGGDGEFKLRGVARIEDDPEVQRCYASAMAASVGWEPVPGRFHLFSIDVDDVVFIRYDDRTGDQFVAAWPPGREFVRRGTSATTLGPAQPRKEFLVPD